MADSTVSNVWQEGLKSLVAEAASASAFGTGETEAGLTAFFGDLSGRPSPLSFDLLKAVSLLGTAVGALGLPAAADPMNRGSEWRAKSYWLEIYEWGLGFVCEVMGRICAAVCGPDRRLIAECDSPQAVAARIAGSALVPMGVPGSVAPGVAALITLILTRSAGESFCARPDRDIVEAIDREIEKEHLKKS